jgi:hypothetical protein
LFIFETEKYFIFEINTNNMRTIFFSLGVLSFMLLFQGCKRERILPTTVMGQVRTYGTEDPIVHPPVRVQLLERISSNVWNSADYYEVIDETMTDENQNFVLTADLNNSKRYYLGIDRNTISESHHYLPLAYRSYTHNRQEWKLQNIGGTVHQNFYMLAKGWVNFHFLSENPQPGDLFSYNLSGGAYELFSGAVDEYRIWDFGGNRERIIALELKRDGVWSNWQEHFFVPAFDTIDIQIRY